MKLLSTVIAIFALCATLSAQITVTRSDYDQLFGATTSTNYQATDASGAAFDIGGTGNGQTWDFTGFSYTSEVTANQFANPASTPYAAQFPNATHAVLIDGQEGGSYVYIRLTDNGFYQDGMAGVYQGQQLILDYNPDKPEILFPATLNSNWNYQGDPILFAGGSYTQEIRTQSEIDAAGTMILPSGQHECLRLRTTEWQTTKVVVGGQTVSQQVYKSVSYDFITKSGITASVGADSVSALTGSINVEDVSYTVFGGQVGTGAIPEAESLSLTASYPNPVAAGGYVTIGWNVPSQSPISVTLYNAQGSEVRTLFRGVSAPGLYTHSVDTGLLRPGVYFVRLTSGNRVSTKTLTVVQ